MLPRGANYAQFRIICQNPIARRQDRLLGRPIRMTKHMPFRISFVVFVVRTVPVERLPRSSGLSDVCNHRPVMKSDICEDGREGEIVRNNEST
jgi:hypothetical protein